MRGVWLIWVSLVVVEMTMISGCAHQQPSPISEVVNAQAEKHPRAPNEYLVTLAPNVDETIIYEYYKRFGITYVHELEEDTFLVILNQDPGPQEMEALIQNESRIKMVQPNLISWGYR